MNGNLATLGKIQHRTTGKKASKQVLLAIRVFVGARLGTCVVSTKDLLAYYRSVVGEPGRKKKEEFSRFSANSKGDGNSMGNSTRITVALQSREIQGEIRLDHASVRRSARRRTHHVMARTAQGPAIHRRSAVVVAGRGCTW